MQSRDSILIYIGIKWIFLCYFAQKVSLCDKFVKKSLAVFRKMFYFALQECRKIVKTIFIINFKD